MCDARSTAEILITSQSWIHHESIHGWPWSASRSLITNTYIHVLIVKGQLGGGGALSFRKSVRPTRQQPTAARAQVKFCVFKPIYGKRKRMAEEDSKRQTDRSFVRGQGFLCMQHAVLFVCIENTHNTVNHDTIHSFNQSSSSSVELTVFYHHKELNERAAVSWWWGESSTAVWSRSRCCWLAGWLADW